MTTFTIKVVQQDSGYVQVEANSRKEAKQLAAELLWQDLSNVEWDSGSVEFKLTQET